MFSDWKLDVGRLIRAILVQRYLVLFGTVLLTLLGIGLLSLKDDRYTATALIVVDERLSEEAEQEGSGDAPADDGEDVLGHVELIKSPPVMRRALKTLNGEEGRPVDASEASGGLLSSAAKAIPSDLWADGADEAGDGEGGAVRQSADVLAFADAVEVVGRSQLIKVAFTDGDAARAAAGANALADAYIDVKREERGDDIGAEVTARPSSGASPAEQEIAETQAQLTTAELDSVALSSKVQSIETALANDDPLGVVEIAEHEQVRDLRAQIRAFRAEQAELQAAYGQDHPLMVAKEDQIALAQQSLDSTIENVVTGFRNRSEGARQQVVVLQQLLQQQKQDLANGNPGASPVIDARDLDVDAAALPLDIKIAARAEVPGEPSGPHRMLWSFLFLIGGFLLSSSAAVAREVTRRVVRDPRDLKSVVMNAKVWIVPRRDSERRRAEADNLHQVIRTMPYAHFSASVRNIYSRTVTTLADKQHTVMLSSAQPGDGKTTMSLCFAEVAANAGRSVVLVDTDFRRPKIHERTGLGQIVGLSDWLEGTEPLRCKRPDGCEFYTITAGMAPMLNPDRWNTDTIKELLETLQDRFETIILDTPPIAALADPFLLAAESSMVLFVTRYQHTKLNYIRDLVPPLAERARRMEIILTDVDIKAAAAQGLKGPMEYYQDTAGYYTD